MTGRVVLCADTASMRYPEAMGLEGEDLLSQPWLRVFSQAEEARSFIRGNAVDQVWVASCNDVDPINSAAAFKSDLPFQQVCLVSFDKSGSLQSRAHQAGIDAVLDRREFVGRYGEEKRRYRSERGTRSFSDVKSATWDEGPRSLSKEYTMRTHDSADILSDEQATKLQGDSSVLPDKKAAKSHGDLGVSALRASDVPAISVSAPGDSFAAAAFQDARSAVGHLPEIALSESEAAASDNAADVFRASRALHSATPHSEEHASFAHIPKTDFGKKAFIMPVVSGSGGAGKSTIAVLCAVIARNRGYETLLLDLDLQFGDAQTLLGVKDPLHLDDLLDSPAKLSSVRSQENLPAFIAAPRRFERAEEVAERLPELLDILQTRYDVIVANTGGFWAEQHAVMLERSSRALFLIDQRPSSLVACKRALELCARCGIATSPLLFAVNRCTKNALYSSIDVSCTLRGAPAVELRDGGREVEELVSAGHPFELLSNPNDLGESLIRLMDEVLPKRASAESSEMRPMPSRKRTHGIFRASRRRDAACLG